MVEIQKNDSWAVMLCGGLGSRMGSLTSKTPKSLLMVSGKPIIWYSFWTLYKYGFRNFILPLGYLGNMIHEYMKKNSIDIILDQRQIFIGNTNKDITKKILTIVNQKFPDNE